MAEFAVEVVKLTIEEHPNADALELAVIGDYRAVVLKDQFKTGNLGVYLPEQSIVPEWLIVRLGLEGRLAGKQRNRVKAIKLRQQISQGLVVPLEGESELANENILISVNLGDDVTEFLGITKWEPKIPTSMNGKCWNAMGRTIHFDIENVKRYPEILQDGEEVIFSEKIHGCTTFDTIIETVEHGWICIGDIVRNKTPCHVKSYDIISGSVQFNEVVGYSETPDTGDWYELETDSGDIIRLTGNHLIWLPELHCYRAVEDLKGDEVLLFN
jgi:RNA ligase (TIGR02306 family)